MDERDAIASSRQVAVSIWLPSRLPTGYNLVGAMIVTRGDVRV